MTEAEHKITDKTITEMLVQHFKDDDVRFNKLTEIALQNGEHLSYFNKNLEEVKTMIVKSEEESKLHRARVEPVIKAYEESLIIKASNDKVVEKVGKMAWLVGSITILGSAIIWVAKKVL